MMDKRFLESFLRLNNISVNAPAAEVEAALTRANWPKEEIQEALLTRARDDGAALTLPKLNHGQAFRPDMELPSERLSSLLGIDVIVDPTALRLSATTHEHFAEMRRKVLSWLAAGATAILIAAAIGIAFAYFFEIWPFYTHTESII